MKETIKITDYANRITEALPKGILLNTKHKKCRYKKSSWPPENPLRKKYVQKYYKIEKRKKYTT